MLLQDNIAAVLLHNIMSCCRSINELQYFIIAVVVVVVVVHVPVPVALTDARGTVVSPCVIWFRSQNSLFRFHVITWLPWDNGSNCLQWSFEWSCWKTWPFLAITLRCSRRWLCSQDVLTYLLKRTISRMIHKGVTWQINYPYQILDVLIWGNSCILQCMQPQPISTAGQMHMFSVVAGLTADAEHAVPGVPVSATSKTMPWLV